MAEKLRHFLHVAEEQDISVAALSEKSDISKPTIYRYANGHAAHQHGKAGDAVRHDNTRV